MICDSEHPDLPGVRCQTDAGRFPRHAWHSSTAVPEPWPNLEAQVVEDRRRAHSPRANQDRLLGFARATDENVRERNRQQDLDRPHSYLRRGPHDTEVAAARAVLPRSGTQRRAVYDAIVSAGAEGLADEEVQERLGIKSQSETPRRGELVEAGLIEDSGRRRRVASGLSSIVWVATPR